MVTPYSPYNRRSIVWVDFAGRERYTNLTALTLAGAPATFAAVVACSVADWQCWYEGPVIPTPGEHPTSAYKYTTCGYVLAINLLSTASDYNRIFLPAPLTVASSPKVTLLLSDNQTLDVSSGATTVMAGILMGELNHPLTGDAVTDIRTGWVTHSAAALSERLGIISPEAIYRRNVEFIDASGRRFTMLLTSRAGAPLSMENLRLASNAVITRFWEGLVTTNAALAPQDVPFWSIADEAVMVFQDDTGTRTYIIIPAPMRNMFMGDGKTVNTNSVEVANVIDAALSEIVVPGTNLRVTSYVGGFYSHNRQYGT